MRNSQGSAGRGSVENRSKQGESIQSQRAGKFAAAGAIDWSETPIFAYYSQNQALIDVHAFHQIGHDPRTGYLAWDKNHRTNWNVDKLLAKIKQHAEEYKAEQVHGPLYVQALVTLKFLFEEQ